MCIGLALCRNLSTISAGGKLAKGSDYDPQDGSNKKRLSSSRRSAGGDYEIGDDFYISRQEDQRQSGTRRAALRPS